MLPAEFTMAIERVNVLGVGISVINLPTALAAIADAVRARRKGYICVTGVHGVMEAQDDAAFRKILNEAFLCTPDGMPMVWAGKLQRPLRDEPRLRAGLDAGRLRLERKKSVPPFFFRRRAGRGGGACATN